MLEFSMQAKNAKTSTEKKELQLSKETGAKAGRTLAASPISHREMSAAQLYTLGFPIPMHTRMERRLIFTSLANMPETDTYRTPKHLIATGVAWYKVENYSLADTYFNEVLKKPETDSNLHYMAQARLWKALVARRLNKEMKAQYWLRELVDHHPHSPEAMWVNPTEVKNAEE